MTNDQLLERIAITLRRDIGPAVDGEYPRTQAFMAAVVLQKLARELANAAAHRTADSADRAALVADIQALTAGASLPPVVTAAVAALVHNPDDAALCALIEALYAGRAALGPARFEALLGRIRKMLRAGIDRRVVVAA